MLDHQRDRYKRIFPKFSLSALFWLILVFSAFLVGRRSLHQPVVIASRDLAIRNRIYPKDFHVAYRPCTEIPIDALSDLSSLEGKFLCKPIASGEIPVTNDFVSIPIVSNVLFPQHLDVVDIELPMRINPLASYLLEPGDLVGLEVEKNGIRHSLDIPPVRVFNIGYSGSSGIAGVLVDEQTEQLISEHRKLGQSIFIGVPRKTKTR